MTTWLIALGVVEVGMLAFIWLLARRSTRTYRSCFVWASLCLLVCIGLNVAGLAQGLGSEPMESPGNYVPFIILMNIFFLPAGLLAALVGWRDSQEELKATRRQQRAAGTSPPGRRLP